MSLAYETFKSLQDRPPNGHSHIVVLLRDYLGLVDMQYLRSTNSALQDKIQGYTNLKNMDKETALYLQSRNILVRKLTSCNSFTVYHCMSKLQYLQFNNSFIHPINCADLPRGLQQLHLGRCFNHPINCTELPRELQQLHLGRCFNHPINCGALPRGLQKLHLGGCFNHPIDCGAVPEGCEICTTYL